MKARLYSQLEFLTCSEAIEYASDLFGVELNHKSFERLVLPHISGYLDFNEACFHGYSYSGEDYENETRVQPNDDVTPHKMITARVCTSEFGAYIAEVFQEYLSLVGMCREFGTLNKGRNLGVIEWVLDEGYASELLHFHQFIEYRPPDEGMPAVVFSTSDIEALAAKMNNEPKAQALQQETEALKVEVALAREPKQTRSNPVREVMLGIVKHQPDIKTAEMWARIKEMADSQIWPFVHGGAEGEIKYEDGEKIGFLKKRNVGERLKRIKDTR